MSEGKSVSWPPGALRRTDAGWEHDYSDIPYIGPVDASWRWQVHPLGDGWLIVWRHKVPAANQLFRDQTSAMQFSGTLEGAANLAATLTGGLGEPAAYGCHLP